MDNHICWNVPMEARIEPPTHAPNLRSTLPLAAINFKRIDPGVRKDRSRLRRSPNPYKINIDIHLNNKNINIIKKCVKYT